MNSEIEDFPVPVSPIRRRVYGLCASFFDVLIIPLLRDFTSLANRVRTGVSKVPVHETYLIVGALSLHTAVEGRAADNAIWAMC